MSIIKYSPASSQTDSHSIGLCYEPPTRHRHLWLPLMICVLLISMLSGCTRPDQVEKIKSEGVLHVATRVGPLTYYETDDGPAGFEYELAVRFAEYLGVEPRIRVTQGVPELYEIIGQGFTDIAATGLSQQAARSLHPKFRFGPVYKQFQPLVLYRRGTTRPRELSDLLGKSVLVPARTAQIDYLIDMQANDYPQLLWQERDTLDPADILSLIDAQAHDFAIMNSYEYGIHSAMFPEVSKAFELMDPLDVSWVFPPGKDNSLLEAAQHFFTEIEQDGTLALLRERYFGHIDQLDYVNAAVFQRDAKERLSRFLDFFLAASAKEDLDWRLLAAMGYQESHWRPYARSPTGVRGLMMLTLRTAKEVGIKNRLDPESSVRGAAVYLRGLRQRLDEDIVEPDRTWFALAAYNVGIGHVRDAQEITRQKGDDPNKWVNVMKYLPLLQNREYYEKTRYGKARGWEPVHYVQNIRRFYDVLAWLDDTGRLHDIISREASETLKAFAATGQVDPDSMAGTTPLHTTAGDDASAEAGTDPARRVLLEQVSGGFILAM
ncbi:membrane-bound lytic murein transglycosylase MltF [Allohahella sp. A8]|uniref:membrane-bound lytic murein transglycosylase MltF n=1 Tax=Allohahella sp. A8 TaxID=3141461 RepID=UPI003A80BFDA